VLSANELETEDDIKEEFKLELNKLFTEVLIIEGTVLFRFTIVELIVDAIVEFTSLVIEGTELLRSIAVLFIFDSIVLNDELIVGVVTIFEEVSQ